MMAYTLAVAGMPVPEKLLRDLPKDLPRVIPNFAEKEQTRGVKELQDLVDPILETAEIADVTPSHRAAACNALCAIIENVQLSDVEYARNSVLDDFIWFRFFQIYLQKCDEAKGKSVRQILLVLTGALLNNESPASSMLQERAASTIIDIICLRHDRRKVKPALQGLAHFLQKNVMSIPQLIDLYRKTLSEQNLTSRTEPEFAQSLFSSFLAWIVHHDTSLSAGHLLKNYLTRLRQSSRYELRNSNGRIIPIWIKPVISALHLWPDRIQEFKTHVFPYCFLPEINEYLQFISYLHFGKHVTTKARLPDFIQVHKNCQTELHGFEEFKVLLAAIQTGKELAIIIDVDHRQCGTVEVFRNTIHLPDDTFGDWLSNPEAEVRLAGLFSSVYSTNVTRPITDSGVKSLQRNLVHLHTDTDANFRRETLGYTQKLFDRLRGSTSALAKLRGKGGISEQGQNSLPVPHSSYWRYAPSTPIKEPFAKSLDFVVWYIQFLEWELRSTSSYQRRITALRALTIVLKSGLDPRVPRHYLSRSAQGQLHWPFGLKICSPKLIRTLLDMMLDAFDDVRSASTSVLELCLDSYTIEEKKSILLTLPRFISRAETAMLRTGRADQADGLARAYSLLFSQCTEASSTKQPDDSNFMTRSGIVSRLVEQLEDTITMARNDMSLAVDGRPVHGIFAALRYIIDRENFYSDLVALTSTQLNEWRTIHVRICASYEELWSCIRNILCADAPEGHIPEELEEETSLDTKEILSYSWRGLKEASILLRVIISKAPIGTHEHSLVDQKNFEKLGKLCFTQLVDLRHRGAFSTVAQTFAAFCRRCLLTDDAFLRGLPGKWYQETLLCIQDKADSITRRSAGIPALMTSIIAAETQPDSTTLFSRAMKDLVAEASSDAQDTNIEESRLPQVHAINCIKEMFMTSKLSAASEPYLGECLNLAATSLNSKIWPIRNCSLVLFKALIERLLGSDEAQDWKERDRTKTSRFSYQNYPGLVGILFDLLDSNELLRKSMDTAVHSSSPLDLHGAEGVFPALQILRQAPPPEKEIDAMMKSVLHLVSSPHWHLRDMAARTLVSLQDPDHDIHSIVMLLSFSDGPHNLRHGRLLALKYILKRFLRNSQNSAPGKLSYMLQIASLLYRFQQESGNVSVLRKGGAGTVEELLVILGNASYTAFTKSNCSFTISSFLDLVNLCGIAILQQDRYQTSPPEEWETLTDALGKVAEVRDATISDSALLRRSKTQYRAINQAVSGSRPGPALLRLSRVDPDSCLALLETLSEVIDAKSSTDPAYTTALVAQIHLFSLNADDDEIVSKAQAVLAYSLLNQERRAAFFENAREENVMRSLDKLETNCLEGSPSNVKSALHVLGFFLDFAFHSYPHHKQDILQRIARYIRILRRIIDEENPFDLRFAAVQSLCGLSNIWTLSSTSKLTSPLLLALCIIIYDLLNDDDDEIRDASAVATSRLLVLQSHEPFVTVKPVVPILTTYRLAKYLTTYFATSSSLASEATRRLTGSSSTSLLFSTPFATTLALERKEDNALFSTEKRNLFKDDTLDTALWSRVLRRIDPMAISAEHREGLREWVLDGLAVFTETAVREGDGALGWTSKAEVFTLGIRVICVAEVILRWGGDHTGKVRRALRELADVEDGIHGLWVEKIERVLEESVFETLRRVRESLSVT